MKFKSLCELPHDAGTGRIHIEPLRAALPAVPTPVLVQFYADHGRNAEFQDQYGHLELDDIGWTLASRTAREICSCSMKEGFRSWFEEVGRRAAQFPTRGWTCIDVRQEVQEHWRDRASWIESPILIDGSIVGASAAMHLVEGHTRVGLLAGLVQASILPPDSIHTIWLGALIDSGTLPAPAREKGNVVPG